MLALLHYYKLINVSSTPPELFDDVTAWRELLSPKAFAIVGCAMTQFHYYDLNYLEQVKNVTLGMVLRVFPREECPDC